MVSVPVWRRGDPAPADLATGTYELVFEGSSTVCRGVEGAVKANRLLNRTLGPALPGIGPLFAGIEWALTLHRVEVEAVPSTPGRSFLIIRAEVRGFPWALLLVVLGIVFGGAFGLLSLVEIRRVLLEGGTAGRLVLVLGVLVAAVIALPPMIRSVRKVAT